MGHPQNFSVSLISTVLDLKKDFLWLEAVSLSSSVDMRARGGRNCTPTSSLLEFVRILMNFFRFFLIFEIFFLVLKKQSKVMKFGYVLAKRLGSTLMKFLDNRSKRFANTSQTFFDKQGFQKLDENLNKIIRFRTKWKNQVWLKKSYVTGFLLNHFFFY